MKRISHLFLTAALSLVAALPASAEKDHPLVGIWQQVQSSENGKHLVHLPVWKVVQSDGRFALFLIANREGKSIQTTRGTYKVKSDTVYVEHLTGSITDPDLVGRDNKISYKFSNKDNNLSITYTLPGRQKPGEETWVRVKLEVPQ